MRVCVCPLLGVCTCLTGCCCLHPLHPPAIYLNQIRHQVAALYWDTRVIVLLNEPWHFGCLCSKQSPKISSPFSKLQQEIGDLLGPLKQRGCSTRRITTHCIELSPVLLCFTLFVLSRQHDKKLCSNKINNFLGYMFIQTLPWGWVMLNSPLAHRLVQVKAWTWSNLNAQKA